ncbi:IS110 family transposase [Salmonella enterica]|nr:IS110 family transposase [Salmonella enterica]
MALDDELMWYDNQQRRNAASDSVCQRLLSVPGFGPLVSLAVKSWMGDGKQFKRGHDASAALGLVPRQFSTGGRQVLLGITKCGNNYVRARIDADHDFASLRSISCEYTLCQINADTWCPGCFLQIRRQDGST